MRCVCVIARQTSGWMEGMRQEAKRTYGESITEQGDDNKDRNKETRREARGGNRVGRYINLSETGFWPFSGKLC